MSGCERATTLRWGGSIDEQPALVGREEEEGASPSPRRGMSRRWCCCSAGLVSGGCCQRVAGRTAGGFFLLDVFCVSERRVDRRVVFFCCCFYEKIYRWKKGGRSWKWRASSCVVSAWRRLLLAIQPRLHAELLWRRGRCWSTIAIPVPTFCYETTLLWLLAIEHPTRVARACKAIDSID